MTDRRDAVAAIEEAARYKTKRNAVQNILARRKEKAEELCQKLEHGEWYPPHHEKHRIQEGSHKKVREIIKPRFDDEQLVHHMLARQLRPIVTARLYRYVFGSLPGRGTHAAVRAMKRWRDSYGGKRFYVFEGDIKSFYDTVGTELLKAMWRSASGTGGILMCCTGSSMALRQDCPRGSTHRRGWPTSTWRPWTTS